MDVSDVAIVEYITHKDNCHDGKYHNRPALFDSLLRLLHSLPCLYHTRLLLLQ